MRAAKAGSRAVSAWGIAARRDGRRVIVRLAEVAWIAADGNYCVLHRRGETHRRKEALASLLPRLPRDRFVRVSRSAAVNVDHVRELRPKSHGDATVLLDDGATLKVSRTRRPELARRQGRP